MYRKQLLPYKIQSKE